MNYGKCVMTHPSDLAPALIALRAKVIISSTSEQKQIPIEDFYQDANPSTETILKPDELLTEIQIPIQKGRTYQLFLKHRIRHSSDFALSSIAVVARISHEVCEDIRVVLGGVAPFPYIVSPVEDLLQGKKKDEELISKAVEISVEGARPLPMNRYKIDLTKALVKRVLTSLWQESAQA